MSFADFFDNNDEYFNYKKFNIYLKNNIKRRIKNIEDFEIKTGINNTKFELFNKEVNLKIFMIDDLSFKIEYNNGNIIQRKVDFEPGDEEDDLFDVINDVIDGKNKKSMDYSKEIMKVAQHLI